MVNDMRGEIKLDDEFLAGQKSSQAARMIVKKGDVVATACGFDMVFLTKDEMTALGEGKIIWMDVNAGEYVFGLMLEERMNTR